MYISFVQCFGKFTRNEVLQTNSILLHVVDIKIFSLNSGKESRSSLDWHFKLPFSVVRFQGRNFVERNALITVRKVGTTNNHTSNHGLLCTKMVDAWADQLKTSPRARDGNALLGSRFAFLLRICFPLLRMVFALVSCVRMSVHTHPYLRVCAGASACTYI